MGTHPIFESDFDCLTESVYRNRFKMADQHAFKQQYGYQQNSNLVLQVDRQLVDKRAKNEATGEVKSLVGRLGVSKMGDRAVRTSTKEKEELEERKKRKVRE